MSWRDELKPASFKGVPFRTDSASVEFGWNAKIKEQASPSGIQWKEGKAPTELSGGQDFDPQIEQGEKGAKVYSVEAHFTGDDYIANRDAFIAVVEEGGAGILQLPLMKPVSVIATRGSAGFSNTAGGYETVTITFLETILKPRPTTISNEKRASETTATEGEASIIAVVTDNFSAVVSGAEELADQVSESLLDVTGFGAVGEKFSDFVTKATAIGEDAREIIQTPQVFAERIIDAISDLTFAFENPIDALNAQINVFETYRDNLVFEENGSEARRLQVVNNTAIALAVENACVQQIGIAALNTEFSTLNDAILIRKEFEDAVRTQQLRNGSSEGWDDMYRILANLLGSVTRYINESANLPSAIDHKFGDENPSFALAQDFYGDADRGDEIVERNEVRNPLFCDRELELLSE